MALLRDRLSARHVRRACELIDLNCDSAVTVAGLVTCRQRPGTASGVIFVTLEDETGCVNVIVWPGVADKQRRALLGARLLMVNGKLQQEAGVVHVIARRLTDLSAWIGNLATPARDFN